MFCFCLGQRAAGTLCAAAMPPFLAKCTFIVAISPDDSSPPTLLINGRNAYQLVADFLGYHGFSAEDRGRSVGLSLHTQHVPEVSRPSMHLDNNLPPIDLPPLPQIETAYRRRPLTNVLGQIPRASPRGPPYSSAG